MRYCWNDNNKRRTGQIMFFTCLMVALWILFSCCSSAIPINIKKGIKDLNKCDHFEVVMNRYAKPDKVFKGMVEMQALNQKLKKGWGRYKIRYFERQLISSTHIGFAVIYYWKSR